MLSAYASEDPKFVSCRESNFSFFFDLLEQETMEGSLPLPFHRFCSLMRKMDAAGYYRETLKPNAEIRAEIEDASTFCHRPLRGDAIRFTFFGATPAKGDLALADEAEFLGYLVWLRLKKRTRQGWQVAREYVLEAVVRIPSLPGAPGQRRVPLLNNYLHCADVFRTTVGKRGSARRFTFPGLFSCQQSALTHVCAHAALRMAWNNTPWLSHSGKFKLTTRRINQLLDIDHKQRKADGGLTVLAMRKVIRRLGAKSLVAAFLTGPDAEYEHFVYPLIESGCPVILGIEMPGEYVGHVVTVVGHTRHSDRWLPEARHVYGKRALQLAPHLSAVEWADHLVAHDDNYGAALSISTEGLDNVLLRRLHASFALAIVPAGVTFWGYRAEQMAAQLVQKLLRQLIELSPGFPARAAAGPLSNRWLHRLCLNRRKEDDRQFCEKLVCRTLLQTRGQYLAFFKQHQLGTVEECAFLRRELPARFWVTELTIPPLYTANRHKLGDVVVRCDGADEMDEGRICFVWLPGHYLFQGQLKDWSIAGHVPLLRTSDVAPSNQEW